MATCSASVANGYPKRKTDDPKVVQVKINASGSTTYYGVLSIQNEYGGYAQKDSIRQYGGGSLSGNLTLEYTCPGYFAARDFGAPARVYACDSQGSATYYYVYADNIRFGSCAAMTITATFDHNNGTGSTSSETETYDSQWVFPTTPEKSGYAFVGWFTEAEGGTEIKSTDTVAFTADQTLYAHWEPMSILHIKDGNDIITCTNIQVVDNGTVRKIIGCYSVENGVVHQGV